MDSTEKNFAGQNLQGRSFRGQNLVGADFSGADLRSTDFTNANLQGANFSQAKMGLEKRWLLPQLIVTLIMSFVFSFPLTIGDCWLASLYTPPLSIRKDEVVFSATVLLTILLAIAGTLGVIMHLGFTKAASKASSVVAVLAGGIGIVAYWFFSGLDWAWLQMVLYLGSWAFLGISGYGLVRTWSMAAVAFWSVVGAVVISETRGMAVMVSVAVTVTVTIIGSGVATMVGYARFFQPGTLKVFWSIAIAVAMVTSILSIYLTWQTLNRNPKFDHLLKFATAFASIGGTSFRGTNLAEAQFIGADLQSSDFRNSRQQVTILTDAIWQGAKNLDRAQLGNSILANPKVRKLLVTGNLNQGRS